MTIREIAALMLQDAARLTERAAQLVTAAEPDEINGAAPAPDDRLITAAEAAPLLGVSVTTLYAYRDRYPFTRKLPGRVVRFSRLGIVEYLRRVDAPPPAEGAESGPSAA